MIQYRRIKGQVTFGIGIDALDPVVKLGGNLHRWYLDFMGNFSWMSSSKTSGLKVSDGPCWGNSVVVMSFGIVDTRKEAECAMIRVKMVITLFPIMLFGL